MRHKQRPTKSSRHKSVTTIIDGLQTSFVDKRHSSKLISSHSDQHFQQQTRSNSNDYSRELVDDADDEDYNDADCNEFNDESSNRCTIITSANESRFAKKHFEHNVKHMSDVMRLAFLENNDISPETWTNIDFNYLTGNILQRNIQRKLQMRTQQPQYEHEYNQDLFDDHIVYSDSEIFRTASPNASKLSHSFSMQGSHDDVDFVQCKMDYDNSFARTSVSNIDPLDQANNSMLNGDFSNQFKRNSESRSNSNVDVEGFLCDEPGCGKSFPSLRKLRHHKVVHSDDFPFVCEFEGCGKKFKRKFGIDLHSTTHFDLDASMYNKTSNNSSLPFFGRRMQYSMCKPCGQKFKTVHEYQYHMLKHGKEPFKCPVKGCGQTFGIWKSFQKHRASHYFNYYCKMDPRCDHHTSNLQLLKLHIYCCHFRRKLPRNTTLTSRDDVNNSTRSPPLDLQDSHEDIDPLGSDFTNQLQVYAGNKNSSNNGVEGSLCDEPGGGKSFPSLRRLRHRNSPAKTSVSNIDPPDQANNSMSNGDFSNQFKRNSESRSNSNVGAEGFLPDEPGCGKSFPSLRKLRHRNSPAKTSVSNIDPLDQANNSMLNGDFSNQFKRNSESRSNSNVDVEGFLCDEPGCGKSFPSLRKLRHHKVVHSDDFPFVCEFEGCGKKFKRKFGIDLHSTTHFDLDASMYNKTSNNSSLPFFGRRMQYSMCKPCGQKFKTVHEYQYHMLKHGKEPFKCPVKGCGQTFGIWKSFQKHRASHYFNYYCKMDPRCDHHTSNLQLLKLHIYCCHFRRKLPKNTTLSSRDEADNPSKDAFIEDDDE